MKISHDRNYVLLELPIFFSIPAIYSKKTSTLSQLLLLTFTIELKFFFLEKYYYYKKPKLYVKVIMYIKL